MDAPSMMPEQWIERLFARLSAIYGNRMTAMWGDCQRADIMAAWGEALGKINAEHVRMALGGVMQAHPEWPPTLGEFLALCKPPPASHRPALTRTVSKRVAPPMGFEALKAKCQSRKRDPEADAEREAIQGEASSTWNA